MSNRRLLAAGLLVAILLPIPAVAQEEPPPKATSLRPTDGETGAFFEWFDGLFPPADWAKPFVAYTDGSCSKGEGEPWKVIEYFGFLAEDAGPSFRVLTFELDVRTLTKSDGGEDHLEGADRVGYSPADLDAFVAGRLEAAREAMRVNCSSGWGVETPEYWVHDETRFLALARACWARDRRQAARDLLGAARWMAGATGNRTLRVDLGKTVAWVLQGRAIKTLPDPAVGRPALLARLERLATEFPEVDEGPWVRGGPGPGLRSCVAVLRRMVAEEAAHRPPEGFPDRCSPEQHAREWVWRLRDQGGIQTSQPGFCDLFAVEGKAREPADALLAMGEQAVPALIEVLGDDRWTRGLEGRGEPLRPYTFGDAARQILWSIAGRDFETRESAEAWWREVREKGMEQVLVEAVRRGDRESPHQARILMKRYPGSAMPALLAGLKASSDWWERGYLALLVGKIEGDGPVAALIEEAMTGPILVGRIEASRALRDRGRPEGLGAMVNALKTMDLHSGVWRFDDLVEDLAGSREMAALRALREGFPKLDLSGKFLVLGSVFTVAREDPSPSKEWRAEAEALLADAVDDGEPTWGGADRFGDREVDNLRVRDLAAARLGELRGDPAAAGMPDPPCRRFRWILAILNGWRRAQGLDPHLEPPPPSEPHPTPPPDPKVADLLRSVTAASDSRVRAAAVENLRNLGLDVLAPAEEALRGLAPDHPARPVLEDAVRELAFRIGVVRADDTGLPPPEPIRALLRGLRGTALRPEGVVELLMECLRALPPESEGVEIGLERCGEGCGVNLRIRILKPRRGPRRTDRPEPMWTRSETILVSGREIHSRHTGTTRYSTPLPPDGEWESLAEALGRVLGTPPGEPVDVQVRVTRE